MPVLGTDLFLLSAKKLRKHCVSELQIQRLMLYYCKACALGMEQQKWVLNVMQFENQLHATQIFNREPWIKSLELVQTIKDHFIVCQVS